MVSPKLELCSKGKRGNRQTIVSWLYSTSQEGYKLVEPDSQGAQKEWQDKSVYRLSKAE